MWLALFGLALALALAGRVAPAFAEAAVAVSEPALVIPWGDMVALIVQVLNAALVPIAGVYVGKAVNSALKAYAPALAQILTNRLIDRMIRLAIDFALQAVEGAAKGRTTTVTVAPAVVAVGAQRALDSSLPWIVNAAGGPQGIAERIFRQLDLEPAASAETVLAPALDALGVASTHG